LQGTSVVTNVVSQGVGVAQGVDDRVVTGVSVVRRADVAVDVIAGVSVGLVEAVGSVEDAVVVALVEGNSGVVVLAGVGVVLGLGVDVVLGVVAGVNVGARVDVNIDVCLGVVVGLSVVGIGDVLSRNS